MHRFNGQTVVIMGAAGSLGWAKAVRFAGEGAQVARYESVDRWRANVGAVDQRS